MGIPLFRISSCDIDNGKLLSSLKNKFSKFRDKNPDPSKFIILSHSQIGNFCIVELEYQNCTNFEGRKILVFRASFDEIKSMNKIDPHFCNESHLSPIARFLPTREGWNYANLFVKTLSRAEERLLK